MLRSALRSIFGRSRRVAKPCPDYIGASGLTYKFEKLIQRRPEIGSVWIAQANTHQYILKELPESFYQNFAEHIWPSLLRAAHPNVRLPCDTIPNERVLVYKYFSHDLLEIGRTKIGSPQKKIILKSVLEGLAAMHEHDIVHLDIKPDNIVIDCEGDLDEAVAINAVQITDLENAIWLQPGKDLRGSLAGNENWRSPEAHVRERLNKPTDLFSFGVICIYVMLGRIIFGRDADFHHQVSQGNDPLAIRLVRAASYFGDEAGYKGLRRHFGEEEKLCELMDVMWEDRHSPDIPYRHFSTWTEVDDGEFKDVVLKLMNLDPQGRITAKQALLHPWFAKVEAV